MAANIHPSVVETHSSTDDLETSNASNEKVEGLHVEKVGTRNSQVEYGIDEARQKKVMSVHVTLHVQTPETDSS
jgi:hypothetical protein